MAIMSALVLYVIPALLGRSYDLRKEVVGPDIFDRKLVEEKTRIIKSYMTTSEYKVVSELSEVSDFLDISAQAALKLKIGATDVQGSGSYLRDSTNFDNKVDLLVKVHYETEIYTLPSDIGPRKGWDKAVDGFQATHYIRSILFGGDLIASIRFTTQSDADKTKILGMIQASLNAKSGSFGAGLKANLDMIKEQTKDKATMDINYYATVPLEKIPRDIDGLVNLVQDFPRQTKLVNKGLGVPLKMEIFSIKGIQQNRTAYWQTLAMGDQMSVVEEMLSDVRNAKKRLSDWMRTIPPALPKEQKDKVGMFQSKLDSVDQAFSVAIANMDLSHDAPTNQFKAAFEAYRDNREAAMPDLYLNLLSKLKTDVLKHSPSFETELGGRHYNYWGFDNCTESAITMFSGVMMASSNNVLGSSEFMCMPDERQEIDIVPGPEDEDEEGLTDKLPQIVPVTFKSRKDGKDMLVKCSSCRVAGRSSVTTLIGESKCPENWTLQYQGVLASATVDTSRGDLICLDTNKVAESQPQAKKHDDAKTIAEITPQCGPFPCKPTGADEKSALPCVVCSLKKPTKDFAVSRF